MQKFIVVGFRYGVYTSMVINTIYECVEQRAKERGFTEILRTEEM